MLQTLNEIQSQNLNDGWPREGHPYNRDGNPGWQRFCRGGPPWPPHGFANSQIKLRWIVSEECNTVLRRSNFPTEVHDVQKATFAFSRCVND